MNIDVNRLLEQAEIAKNRAYAPYSRFSVGCALLDAKGRVHLGCNVENASYGAAVCAERTALFRAAADGESPHSFQALLVLADTEKPVTPCGICRQVMAELCSPQMPVFLANGKGEVERTDVETLMPGAFKLPAGERSQKNSGNIETGGKNGQRK